MELEEYIKTVLYDPTVSKIITIAIGVAIIWIIIKWIQRRLFTKIQDNENRYKAKKVSTFLGYIFTIILLTIVFSDKLGGLTVALGVAGAGVAFALQEVIASFAGWIAIMFGGFYKTGDRVQLGGIKGDVMDIGVLRTTIMETGDWVNGDLYNGRIVFIANSFVLKEPVYNYSGDFPFLWDEIVVPIDYGSNYEKTEKILMGIGVRFAEDLSLKSQEEWSTLRNKYRLEEAQTEPMISIAAKDSWVEFTLRYVVSYNKRRTMKTKLFKEILKEIDATKGEINFSNNNVYIKEIPKFNIEPSR
jgi:small-conductance mechanosensitive channel